jgi:hypothetical protein
MHIFCMQKSAVYLGKWFSGSVPMTFLSLSNMDGQHCNRPGCRQAISLSNELIQCLEEYQGNLPLGVSPDVARFIKKVLGTKKLRRCKAPLTWGNHEWDIYPLHIATLVANDIQEITYVGKESSAIEFQVFGTKDARNPLEVLKESMTIFLHLAFTDPHGASLHNLHTTHAALISFRPSVHLAEAIGAPKLPIIDLRRTEMWRKQPELTDDALDSKFTWLPPGFWLPPEPQDPTCTTHVWILTGKSVWIVWEGTLDNAEAICYRESRHKSLSFNWCLHNLKKPKVRTFHPSKPKLMYL